MSGFNNRARMNWKLQTAIADLAGGAWPKAAREAAIKLTRERREPSEGKRLLVKLRELFAAHGPLLSNNQVQKLLHEDDEWVDFRGRGPISKRQIAVLLDPYDIHPDYIHPRGKTERGYQVEQFATAFRHYLGEGETPTRNRATVRESRSKPRK
jgi:putative DNA primase/helicase